MKLIKNYLDNIFNNKIITKFIGIQNILLTIIFNLTNIEYAKWFHLIKLSLVIPYRNLHYLNKGKPYYLIELCYILLLVNWFYLFCDRVLLNSQETFYRNILYNNSFLYSSGILTIASLATKDIITFRKLIANTRHSLHIENGFLFFVLQKYNIENNIDTHMSINNLIGAIAFYCIWLFTYNKLIYNNLYLSNTPDYENMCTKYFNGNLIQHSIVHIILNIGGLFVGYYAFFNNWLQQLLFSIGYLGMTYFTAVNNKY
jgi:hypothetical protein